MTDRDLLAKRLALIETCVADLRRLARPADLRTDVREERFVEHTLQIAMQALIDVASHIVSDERLGEPRTNRELFDLLARGGFLDPAFAATLRDIDRLPQRAGARLSGRRPRRGRGRASQPPR